MLEFSNNLVKIFSYVFTCYCLVAKVFVYFAWLILINYKCTCLVLKSQDYGILVVRDWVENLVS